MRFYWAFHSRQDFNNRDGSFSRVCCLSIKEGGATGFRHFCRLRTPFPAFLPIKRIGKLNKECVPLYILMYE